MKNITIAIIVGWIVTFYFAVLILKNSIYVYNVVFLLVLSAIYNTIMINYEANMSSADILKKPKKRKRKKKKK